MRQKWLLILLAIGLLSGSALAQKANFELAERFTTDKLTKMVGSRSVRPNWLKESDFFWYTYKTSNGTQYYLVDPAKKSKTFLFDRENMAVQLTRITHHPYNSRDLPLKKIDFKDSRTQFTFEVDSLKFKYHLRTRQVTLLDTIDRKAEKKLLKNQRWAKFSPDSNWVAFAKNHNLYIMRSDDPDSVEIQLTTDGERWYSYASDHGDTTQEKRIRTRATWFKDSKKFFVTRQDYRKVGELFVINSIKKPRPELETYKYAMPGEKEHYIDELLIIDPADTSVVRLDTDKWKDQSIGGVYFSGGGIFPTKGSDKIYFLRRDRTWSKVDVCVGNTETGEVKALISEESKPYFNTRYAYLHVINDGKDLIWWSERDGWGHFYLYDGEGNLKNQITKGYYMAGDVARIDTAGRMLYISVNGRDPDLDPYYNIYYKVGFDGSGMSRLTPENATHSWSMNDKARFAVDSYSRVDQSPRSVLRDSRGNVILELEKTDISRLLEIGWQMPETFIVKADDGVTDLYGVMWKPFDFDPEKKYPIITYVYPGPQSEPVPKPFTITGSRGRNVALAQLGFVVVAVGNRGGSPQRSKYYHNFGYGNNRDYPLDDNKTALEQLAAKHHFIDISRVGIFGHSGGGNMSTAAILKYPDFYTAAVSSAGNHDNNIYNIWWGEVHYGVKEIEKKIKSKDKEEKKVEKKEGEEDEKREDEKSKVTFKTDIDDNAELAKNLKGHLLLVHGDVDNNVHPANTTRVVDALIKAGKRFDLMFLPGKRHSFGSYSKYFERMMWYYFAEHLLGDYRDNIEIYHPGK